MTRLQSNRRFSTCHRHPAESFTGFCPSCLHERLRGINSNSRHEIPTSTAPDLRRCKSQSFSRFENHGNSSISEPRRNSFDIGVYDSLSDLLNIANKRRLSDLGNELREIEENDEDIGVSTAVSEGTNAHALNNNRNACDDFDEKVEFKTIKEFIDLELESKQNNMKKNLRGIAGNVWEAASMLSKKLRKWNQKQKNKQHQQHPTTDSHEQIEKPNVSVSQIREVNSGSGLYSHGRRSCDSDPRLSIKPTRISLDEPRASCDGYFIGKTYPRVTPLMSTVEEKGNLKCEGERSPGGTAQTRDYYGEPLNLHRGRRSFDRSRSNRRVEFEDFDDVKAVFNSKLSPETVGLFHGAKVLVTEKELRDSNWYSINDESNDDVLNLKKSRKWLNLRNIWGSMNKCEIKNGDEANGIKGTKKNESFSDKLLRSYNLSTGNLSKLEELMLQRNTSSRYSPNKLDNGLLRFYLTPLRGDTPNKTGESKLNGLPSMGRDAL